MPDLHNFGQHGVLRQDVEYGQPIGLTCVHHPHLTWSTKNIAPIGARNIYYESRDKPECSCPASDLIIKPVCVAEAATLVPAR